MSTTRRSFLKKLGLGLGALPILGSIPGPVRASAPGAFTFAHLTDMHVQRKRAGHLGYRACVDAVNGLDPRPDFVLMGGDMAFDGLYTDKQVFLDSIDLFVTESDRLAMPWYGCLGNHDILGWSSRRKVPVDDPDLGKGLMLKAARMPHSWYSFDRNGWHFVVLDTLHPVQVESGPSYKPGIGAEQLEWLRYDLGAAAGKPTVVLMHIAAFCHSPQISGNLESRAYSGLVIEDNLALRTILERHGVKAVIQGHTHQIEDFYWNGIWYITSASVSAAWWGGTWRGFDNGFTVFTAHTDGSLTWERKTFAWEHQLEPEDELERRRIAERADFLAAQRALYEREVMGLRD